MERIEWELSDVMPDVEKPFSEGTFNVLITDSEILEGDIYAIAVEGINPEVQGAKMGLKYWIKNDDGTYNQNTIRILRTLTESILGTDSKGIAHPEEIKNKIVKATFVRTSKGFLRVYKFAVADTEKGEHVI